MPNAFRILKPIQKSSKHVWVFRNTGANAFAKNQMRLAYEDKRDLYCNCPMLEFRRLYADEVMRRFYLFCTKEGLWKLTIDNEKLFSPWHHIIQGYTKEFTGHSLIPHYQFVDCVLINEFSYLEAISPNNEFYWHLGIIYSHRTN